MAFGMSKATNEAMKFMCELEFEMDKTRKLPEFTNKRWEYGDDFCEIELLDFTFKPEYNGGILHYMLKNNIDTVGHKCYSAICFN